MTMHLASLGVGKKTGAATTLVKDNYNTAANGTVLSGETPATGPSPSNPFVGAEFVISSGTANVSTTFPVDIYAALGQSDVSLSSVVHWNGDCDMTYVLRYQDTNNYWTASYDPGSQTLYLIETFGGSSTTRATSVASGHTSGSYSFTAQTSGTILSANLDAGAATVSYSSSDLQSAQSFGVAASFNFGSGGSSGDNFGPLTITHP